MVIDAHAAPRSPVVGVHDVIFTFSYVTWDGAVARGMSFAQDRLLQTLLASPQVRRLLVANPFRSMPRALGRRVLGGDAPFPAGDRVALCSPLRLGRRDPTDVRALQRSYARYDRCLRRAAARLGLERPAVVTMHPLIAGFTPLEWAGPVTFYASDDWTQAPAYRPWWPAYREAYARVRTLGRGLCAVSSAIIERLGPQGPFAVVPNGVDPGEWTVPALAPAAVTATPSPRILYVGTLDERLDVPAVLATARAFATGSVLLAGPVTNPGHLAPLREQANVRFLGRVARDRVPSLMRAADVAVIPHRRTGFTRAMSPLKAYEYLAAGRPVAAADLPPLRQVDDRVVLVGEGEDFVAGVRAALALGPASESARMSFVTANSWASRHERVLDLVLREAPR